eukprot:GHVT01084533.1.p1 GENE.GHVT01084533.1~~GHVT01084533.1.p1  ORF type:complete len:854 (-),score=82.45 GHVT01084533.1:280-2841(-)
MLLYNTMEVATKISSTGKYKLNWNLSAFGDVEHYVEWTDTSDEPPKPRVMQLPDTIMENTNMKPLDILNWIDASVLDALQPPGSSTTTEVKTGAFASGPIYIKDENNRRDFSLVRAGDDVVIYNRGKNVIFGSVCLKGNNVDFLNLDTINEVANTMNVFREKCQAMNNIADKYPNTGPYAACSDDKDGILLSDRRWFNPESGTTPTISLSAEDVQYCANKNMVNGDSQHKNLKKLKPLLNKTVDLSVLGCYPDIPNGALCYYSKFQRFAEDAQNIKIQNKPEKTNTHREYVEKQPYIEVLDRMLHNQLEAHYCDVGEGDEYMFAPANEEMSFMEVWKTNQPKNKCMVSAEEFDDVYTAIISHACNIEDYLHFLFSVDYVLKWEKEDYVPTTRFLCPITSWASEAPLFEATIKLDPSGEAVRVNNDMFQFFNKNFDKNKFDMLKPSCKREPVPQEFIDKYLNCKSISKDPQPTWIPGAELISFRLNNDEKEFSLFQPGLFNKHRFPERLSDRTGLDALISSLFFRSEEFPLDWVEISEAISKRYPNSKKVLVDSQRRIFTVDDTFAGSLSSLFEQDPSRQIFNDDMQLGLKGCIVYNNAVILKHDKYLEPPTVTLKVDGLQPHIMDVASYFYDHYNLSILGLRIKGSWMFNINDWYTAIDLAKEEKAKNIPLEEMAEFTRNWTKEDMKKCQLPVQLDYESQYVTPPFESKYITPLSKSETFLSGFPLAAPICKAVHTTRGQRDLLSDNLGSPPTVSKKNVSTGPGGKGKAKFWVPAVLGSLGVSAGLFAIHKVSKHLLERKNKKVSSECPKPPNCNDEKAGNSNMVPQFTTNLDGAILNGQLSRTAQSKTQQLD